MQHLDGNALAGPLAELFAFEPTMASARCAGCGSVALLAAASVWAGEMGYVVRCSECDQVLATVVRGEGRSWVSLRGISALAVG